MRGTTTEILGYARAVHPIFARIQAQYLVSDSGLMYYMTY